MKKSLLTLVLILLISASFQVKAQKFYIRDIFEFYNDINSEGLSTTQKQKTYSQIDGSPYYHKDFIEGAIITKDGVKYDKIPLRYNAYDDRMEYKHKSGIAFYFTRPEDYKEIIIEDTHFVYGDFTNGKDLIPSYYELMNDGKVSLLKKTKRSLREAEPAKPFSDPKPAKFVSKPDMYFILKDGKKLYEIKNGKAIISILKDKKEEISAYIKANKLKAKKENDLIKIISYYNEIS